MAHGRPPGRGREAQRHDQEGEQLEGAVVALGGEVVATWSSCAAMLGQQPVLQLGVSPVNPGTRSNPCQA